MRNTSYIAASTIFASLLLASPFTMAAGLGDQYFNPYMVHSESETTPSSKMEHSSAQFARYLLNDEISPYRLYDEIVTDMGCTNMVNAFFADENNPYFAMADDKTARQSETC